MHYHGDQDSILLDMQRARRVQRELNRLLSGLLPHIEDRTGHFSRFEWVIEVENDDPLKLTSRLAQLGYAAGEAFKVRLDEFSPTDDSESLAREPDSTYYAKQGFGIRDSLTVPESIDKLILAYFNLDRPAQLRIQRWCHWLNHASQVWNLSPSAGHIAVVQSVEALMPDPDDQGKCECCGRQLGPGPTKQFVDFLEAYAPGTYRAKERSQMYALRSALAHGGRLLNSEAEGLAFEDFTPKTWEQRSLLDLTQMLARLAGVNWLLQSSTV